MRFATLTASVLALASASIASPLEARDTLALVSSSSFKYTYVEWLTALQLDPCPEQLHHLSKCYVLRESCFMNRTLQMLVLTGRPIVTFSGLPEYLHTHSRSTNRTAGFISTFTKTSKSHHFLPSQYLAVFDHPCRQDFRYMDSRRRWRQRSKRCPVRFERQFGVIAEYSRRQWYGRVVRQVRWILAVSVLLVICSRRC